MIAFFFPQLEHEVHVPSEDFNRFEQDTNVPSPDRASMLDLQSDPSPNPEKEPITEDTANRPADSLEPSHLRPSTDESPEIKGPGFRFPVPNESFQRSFESQYAHKGMGSFIDDWIRGFRPRDEILVYNHACGRPYGTLLEDIPGIISNIDAQLDYLYEQNRTMHMSIPNNDPVKLEQFLLELKNSRYGSWNLSAFSPSDVNVALIEILPPEITASLLPMNVEQGLNNFYSAFGIAYLTTADAGEVFRKAVAHRIITNPEEFDSLCTTFDEPKDEVIDHIRKMREPTNVELSILSSLVEKNITVFEFDSNGKLTSDLYFDSNPCRSKESKTIYFGRCGSENERSYFPLIRKMNKVCNPPEAYTSAFNRNNRGVVHPQNISGAENTCHFAAEKPNSNSPALAVSFELLEDLNCTESLENSAFENSTLMDGLINPGNTCFINASLQSIFALPFANKDAFSGFLKDYYAVLHDFRGSPNDQDLAYMKATKALFSQLENFYFGKQADAHEFISNILDKQEGQSLKPLFEFDVRRIYACSTCNETKYALETMSEIFVSPKFHNVETGDGLLTCAETVTCDCVCGAESMILHEGFITTPACLMTVSKIFGDKQVQSPNLKMNAVETLTLSSQNRDATYKIVSLITHIGDTIDSGHYRCFVKKGNSWVCLDDTIVTVKNSISLLKNESVYIQLYVRE